jgi:tellurite resistance protein TerC
MSEIGYFWFEIIALVVLLAVLLADVLIIFKRPHIPSAKESAIWIGFYALLAVVFGLVLLLLFNAEKSSQFYAGWLTEYSLSLDNLFVFVIIMSRFSVPKKYQQEVLMVGVVLALVLRGLFIWAGAALIENFSWIFFVFGGFLVYTAYHQAFRSHKDEEETEGRLIVWLRSRVQVSPDFDGSKIRTTIDGKKMFTPMLIVFVAIAATDVLFAFDSIPAIFGITTDPFIVFTANIFALMGLRQLYFLLGGLLDTLVYLKYGIAFILAFIGVKLVAHAMHVNELPFINGGKHIEWAPEISTNTSLLVIVGAVVISAVASLVVAEKPKK